MIDKDTYLERFRQYLEENGIVKLTKPEDTKEYSYCAFGPVDDFYNFDRFWWNPTMVTMVKAIKEKDSGEYYTINIDIRDDGVIIVTSSRGLATCKNGEYHEVRN